MTKLLPLIVNALYLRLAAPLLALAAQFALSSCDDCLDGTIADRQPLSVVNLKLRFDAEFASTIQSTIQSTSGAATEVGVTIAAYRANDGSAVATNRRAYATFDYSLSFTGSGDYDVALSLPAGQWQLMVWASQVDSEGNVYYDHSDFSNIALIESGGHRGCDDGRDAFSGSAKVVINRGRPHVGAANNDYTIEMSRPMAKYRIITTDLDEFAQSLSWEPAAATDLSRYKIRVAYAGFMPSAFDMLNDGPCDALTGVSYDADIVRISDDEALLAFDYIFAGNGAQSVALAIGVYDSQGRLVATTPPYDIPLKRNCLTTVTGRFLTSQGDGGTVIDSQFSGDFNIKF